MTHIDNSSIMSKEEVKDKLINLVNRSAQKTVQESAYDKTILVKIQYCSDATLGQYKIQYQNGYYTAYSKDTSKTYSNGAMVYVTVPSNDLSNRLFIQDLANNDSSQRTYITNLQGDQQYTKHGSSFIESELPNGLNLSSHWDMPGGRTVTYYEYTPDGINPNNKLTLRDLGPITHDVQTGDGYLRIGAKFKTSDIDPARKMTGDFGIRVVVAYEDYDTSTETYSESYETYELNTFKMNGTPFEFSDYMEQYAYFEIDKDRFKRIQSISGFVKGFPESDIEPIDIYIKDLSIHSALKLYEYTVNDEYAVEIQANEGTIFTADSALASLPLEANLLIRGNKVSEDQNPQYFWAKKNTAVDSTGHCKYLSYFGEGWQCLNQSVEISNDADEPTKEQLENCVVGMLDYPTTYAKRKWLSTKRISIPKTLCRGRSTIIKCAVVYENGCYYSAELTLTNVNGYYMLIDVKNQENRNTQTFFNSQGYATITAGVFQTKVTGTGDSATYDTNITPYSVNDSHVSYKWSIADGRNAEFTLPPTAVSMLYPNEPDWKIRTTGIEGEDSVEVDDNTANAYLSNLAHQLNIDKELIRCCVQRYNYYNDYINNYTGDTQAQEYQTAVGRLNGTRTSDGIKVEWQKYLNRLYNVDYQNQPGYYILGPSNVSASYQGIDTDGLKALYKEKADPQKYAVISNISPQYSSATLYPASKQNTLYKVPAKNIKNGRMNITISTLYTEGGMTEVLETQTISLINKTGTGTKYHVEIDNGDQTFIYNAGGVSPQKRNGVNEGYITVKPLTYKVYKGDKLVFDSAGSDAQKVVTVTNPQWRFYYKSTMLNTQYSYDLDTCRIDTNDSEKYVLTGASAFYFNLADDYNVDYKDRCNVELTLDIIEDENGNAVDEGEYYASTNFNFLKQGDLGTNGTDASLVLYDPSYDIYKSNCLSGQMYSTFTNDTGAVLEYSPGERHLKNTYLCATRIYNRTNDKLDEVMSFDDGDYCNLRFVQDIKENPLVEDPTDPMHLQPGVFAESIVVQGSWFENGKSKAISSSDTDTKWSATVDDNQQIYDRTKYGHRKTYNRASFQVSSPADKSSCTLTLVPPTDIIQNDQSYCYYKPMDVLMNVEGEQREYYAYNVVQCDTREKLDYINTDTTSSSNIHYRHLYGYYQVPFFYYGYYVERNGVYSNQTPDGLDPGRHFVITGGFDQVIYDADGYDPQYSKYPFTLNLFDQHGNDISEEAFNSNNCVVTWSCSYGFGKAPVVSGTLPAYETLPAGKSLAGMYCTYNNKTYRCIVDHTPDQYVRITQPNTEIVIKEYNKNTTAGAYDFVTPYWEEVSSTLINTNRVQNFTPLPTYESMAVNDLFSSWISVKVVYSRNNEKFEAAALLPINILCNMFGSDEINGWDGQKTVVDDGYIISSKVAAGVKDEDNLFTGITIGRKMINNSTNVDEVGLFGYGRYVKGTNGVTGHGQTLFLDAKTGLAAFGPSGSTQIILNPKVPQENTQDESWSRIAGWYISPNYLYKPIWDDTQQEDSDYRTITEKYNTDPPDARGIKIPGSVGMYAPTGKKAEDLNKDTVFLWASASNITSLDFDEDGSLTALKNLVHSFSTLFNRSYFPYYYPQSVKNEVLTPTILYGLAIQNARDLQYTYGSFDDSIETGESGLNEDIQGGFNSNFASLLQMYYALWSDYKNIMETDHADEYSNLVTSLQNIITLMSRGDFPTQTIGGESIVLRIYDDITIENIDEIKSVYCDSNEPSVTARTDLINLLVEYIDDYVTAYQYAVTAVHDDWTTKQMLRTVCSQIQNLGIYDQTIQVPSVDTTAPVLPIINQDQVTIDNINELGDRYPRPAVTATEVQQGYITLLNEKITNYRSLHSKYETWMEHYLDPSNQGAKAVGYKDDDATKLHNCNFCVTYGGTLIAQKAQITGEIRAHSGYIGGDSEHAILISKTIYDTALGRDQFYLLYSPCFRVKGNDAGSATNPSVYIDGTIMARSGQIGNAAETADGSDEHTVFIEYMWYPRWFPDNHSKWGDKDTDGANYRKPRWDTSQGKIVKYAMWHPYFSIIDTPGGAVNKAADGITTDFTYEAGDTAFIGRVYAQGGRIGDWIIDDEQDTLRDPYQTVRFKPNIDGPGHEKSGYVLSGRTIIYGDGSIDGACQTDPSRPGELPTDPQWIIKADGSAEFKNALNKYNGQSYTSGSNTFTSSGVSANAGTFSGLVTASNLNVSNGATFGGNVNCHGVFTTYSQISAHAGILMGGSLKFSGGGGTSIGASSATLPQTNFNGAIDIGGYNINNANTITCSDIQIGAQTLEAYIMSKIADYMQDKSVTITGYTYEAQGHRHLVSLSGNIT